MTTEKREIRAVWATRLLFLTCLVYACVILGIGWNNPLLDFHAFRQTQTALSAYYMIGRPPTLAYETPVFGPPWSIPFEFPVFQWTVAGLVWLLGTPLDQTGRFVSSFFFVATLVPGYYLLGIFRLTPGQRLVTLSLFLVSPFYLFWSRAFLIESTALFFGTAYLAVFVWGWTSPRWPALLAVAVLGALAATIKVTTFAVMLSALFVYLATEWLKKPAVPPPPGSSIRRKTLLILAVAVPVIAALSWTRYTDELKQQNELGRYLTSRGLWHHHFGSWEERITAQTWERILYFGSLALGNKWVWIGCLLSWPLVPGRRKEIVACLAVFFAGPAIFVNVYCRHEYYACANNFLLIAMAGLCLAGLWERKCRLLAAVGLAAMFGASVSGYCTNYYPLQAPDNKHGFLKLCESLEKSTEPGDVVVFLGFDWDSSIAYYSKRRALMVPTENARLEDMDRYISHAERYRFGALLLFRSQLAMDRETLQSVLRLVKLNDEPSYIYKDAIEVYLPRGAAWNGPLGVR